MFLGWEKIGRDGAKPVMPAPGFDWSEIPLLNEAIWERHRHDDFDDIHKRLAASYRRVRRVVESYDDEVLFEKRKYAWTGTTSVGSYAVSATSSHYAWASKLIRRYRKGLGPG